MIYRNLIKTNTNQLILMVGRILLGWLINYQSHYLESSQTVRIKLFAVGWTVSAGKYCKTLISIRFKSILLISCL